MRSQHFTPVPSMLGQRSNHVQEWNVYLHPHIRILKPTKKKRQVLGDTERSFEEAWKAGKLLGWSFSGRGVTAAGGAGGRGVTPAPRPLDLKR